MRKRLFALILLGTLLFGGCNATEETPLLTLTPSPDLIVESDTELTQKPEQPITPIENRDNAEKYENIPFTENQLYAVAYLGYITIEDMDYYRENYLDEEEIPNYYFSGEEYYLIIPRYEDMEVRLYRNDLTSMGKNLEQECETGKLFIVQCNVSDIFPDVTVELVYNGETVGFSPYISLKDGSVQVGERGLDITKQQEEELEEEEWTEISEEEIAWFNEQFFNMDETFRKNNFLNCSYADVKSVNLYDIFYNYSEQISKEEREALRGSEIDFGVDYQKVIASYMDEVLREHMNVSFEEIDKIGLDYYLYLEEFDAYFGCHGDTNYSPVKVKSGIKDEIGTVKLQYLRTEERKEYIVTLRTHDNGYYFVSNCEFE